MAAPTPAVHQACQAPCSTKATMPAQASSASAALRGTVRQADKARRVRTSSGASLRVMGKVPANDVLVIAAVTVITVFTDLATAVLCGIVVAALNFAWQHARELYADSDLQADGSKLYRLHGTLFFASTTPFLNLFDSAGDPPQVTLDCRHLSFVDYSAIAALKTLRERYAKAGKHLRVVHLSERCKQLLKRAGAHD